MTDTPGKGPIAIGMNARLFPNNWRPALDEVAFAHGHGFAALQFHAQPDGLGASHLGAAPDLVGQELRAAGIGAVMEINAWLLPNGQTRAGLTPLDLLHANLEAIDALGCVCVHWHIGLLEPLDDAALAALEQSLAPQLAAGVALGRDHGFRCGFEHNEPEVGLFHSPRSCADILACVPGLSFVWDINHTPPQRTAAFMELAPRMSMVHIADTPLPETNHHLPLGMGTVDVGKAMAELTERGFSGPAILEIGGLPKSGGYGRDTDTALIESRAILATAIGAAYGGRG